MCLDSERIAMLDNAPIRPDYIPLPPGWRKTIDSQVFSASSSVVMIYDTPVFKGTIHWNDNDMYGSQCTCVETDGKKHHACNTGGALEEVLKINEDYCIRQGKDGWQKLLTRPGFEQWIKDECKKRGIPVE